MRSWRVESRHSFPGNGLRVIVCACAQPRNSQEGLLRQILSYLIRFSALLLILTTTAEGVAYASSAMDATAVKQQLMKRGLGKMVKIKETDEESVRGKIVSLGDNSVNLQDGSKLAREIPFSRVAGVHAAGLSKGATITLVVVGGVVIVLAIVVAVIASHAPNLPASIPI
jgi:hypothetical protein